MIDLLGNNIKILNIKKLRFVAHLHILQLNYIK